MNECTMTLGIVGIMTIAEIVLVGFVAYRLGQRDQRRKDEWQYTTYIR